MKLLSSILCNICRFYPLQSGLGTIANSKFLQKIDGNPKTDALVKFGKFGLIVPENDYVGRSIKYFGDLDRKVTWVLRKTLQPGDTALDIGANLGMVSFKMLEMVGSSGKVIAFEPQSRMVDYIQQSIKHNRVENLLLHKEGLADRKDVLRLSIPDSNAGAASFTVENGSHFEEVPVTTLDDFAHEHDLDKVRLIKIDVEGFEENVFVGGKNFLTRVKPDVIVFEENRRTNEIPASILTIKSYGYDVFSLPKVWFSVSLIPYQKGAIAHDFVAIHKDASQKLRSQLGVEAQFVDQTQEH